MYVYPEIPIEIWQTDCAKTFHLGQVKEREACAKLVDQAKTKAELVESAQKIRARGHLWQES